MLKSPRRYSSFRKNWPLFLAALILILVFSTTFVKGIFTGAFSPLFSGANSILSIIPGADFFKSRSVLIEENEILRKNLAEAEATLVGYHALENEYNILLNHFDRASTTEDMLLAEILVRPPVSLYDTLILDVGENDRVSTGDIVVSGSVALGEVRTVYANTSLVVLFSSPGKETEVLLGDEAVRATAVGQGGGNFKIRLPRGVKIEEGMSIVMPHISPTVFGIVGKIVSDPAESFQNILFRNPVNLSTLSKVFILRRYGQ